MPNEHEIHEKIGIATLELLQAARALTQAHSNLLLGHFDQAKEGLYEARVKIRDALEQIPEEKGE